MAIFTDESKIIKEIELQIKDLVESEIEQVIQDAKSELEVKLRKELAGISLQLFKCFEVSRSAEIITIRVRNET